MSTRLGILATHPVQYHSPWFRHLANLMDVKVHYVQRQTAVGQSKAGFGVEFEWDTPLLEGYEYQWLENVGPPGSTGFRRFDTPVIASIIRNGSYSAFLIFGWNHMSAWQALSACQASGVPALMRGDSQLKTPRNLVWRVMKQLPYRFYLSRYSAHLYVGKRNREYLKHYGVSDANLFHAPHFVDVDFFSRKAARARTDGSSEAIRHRLGIPPDSTLFLFAGKLIDKKRPEDFLNAIADLMRTAGGRPAHGLIVGDGPLRPSLERAAEALQANVHFAGFINQNDMPVYYACADALVLPSDARETWGLVVNEAGACGIPAIVSDHAGCVDDLIDDTHTGFRFECGSVSSLTKAMRRLIDTLAVDRPGVTQALERTSRRHSMEAATEGLSAAIARTRRGAKPRRISRATNG